MSIANYIVLKDAFKKCSSSGCVTNWQQKAVDQIEGGIDMRLCSHALSELESAARLGKEAETILGKIKTSAFSKNGVMRAMD